ncbi:succinate dehydrogenase assembly factor 2 [Methylomonas koyamae]|uniref:succinate dehydrogenase assembly factor 2 n=1 Tax=Methylomonas koyamae TaxID=702114 RepID=UPI002110D99A|nr:succinate dehydrogenase assembly factor 2 [Methylomonas koyamae]
MDLLLLRYLERAYLSATSEQQQAFLRILDLEDTELMPYLMADRLRPTLLWRNWLSLSAPYQPHYKRANKPRPLTARRIDAEFSILTYSGFLNAPGVLLLPNLS